MSARGERLLSKFLDFEDLSVSLDELDARVGGPLLLPDDAPRRRGADDVWQGGRIDTGTDRILQALDKDDYRQRMRFESIAEGMMVLAPPMPEPYRSSFLFSLSELLEFYSSTYSSRSTSLSRLSESEAQQPPIADVRNSTSEMDS